MLVVQVICDRKVLTCSEVRFIQNFSWRRNKLAFYDYTKYFVFAHHANSQLIQPPTPSPPPHAESPRMPAASRPESRPSRPSSCSHELSRPTRANSTSSASLYNCAGHTSGRVFSILCSRNDRQRCNTRTGTAFNPLAGIRSFLTFIWERMLPQGRWLCFNPLAGIRSFLTGFFGQPSE